MISLFIDNYSHLLIRILIAGLLGGIIGLERDIHGRSAGLRTHLLVCIGASLFMIMSEQIAIHAKNNGIISSDPARIAAQIVTGIGFLGAGTIIREGFTIRGLTTAACLWVVAAIGMSVGAGYYILAVSTTIVSISLSPIKIHMVSPFWAMVFNMFLFSIIPWDVVRMIDPLQPIFLLIKALDTLKELRPAMI